MEYSQTWSQKVTPAGRSYWAHTASARRTSVSDCGGWPTPDTPSGGGRMTKDPLATKRPSGHKKQLSIDDAAQLAGWPTPDAGVFGTTESPESFLARRAVCAERHGNNGFGLTLGMAATMAGWATPKANERAQSPEAHKKGLYSLMEMAGWCSPASRDWKDTPGMAATGINPDGSERSRLDQLPRQATLAGPIPTGTDAATAKPAGFRLNPLFSLWLMGYPVVWASCGARVTRLSRKPRQSS